MGETDHIAALLRRLASQPRHAFPQARERLEAPTAHGVYIIRDRRDRVLHVGRTYRRVQGLKGRLTDHINGRSSFASAYFGRDGSRVRSECCYQYIEISDPRTRSLLEALACGTLCPRH